MVLNALLVGEKRKRISKELTPTFRDELGVLPIVLEQFPARVVFDKISASQGEHGLTAYNAACLDRPRSGSGQQLATRHTGRGLGPGMQESARAIDSVRFKNSIQSMMSDKFWAALRSSIVNRHQSSIGHEAHPSFLEQRQR